MERYQCTNCFEIKDLLHHFCKVDAKFPIAFPICKTCYLASSGKECCPNCGDRIFEVSKIEQHLNDFWHCPEHENFKKVVKEGSYCKECLKNPENLKNFCMNLQFSTEVPEYMKKIEMFLRKDSKEQVLNFVRYVLSYLKVCCCICWEGLKDSEKSNKVCEQCKDDLLAKSQDFLYNGCSEEAADLYIKGMLSKTFSKFNYLGSFTCKKCGSSFDYSNHVPVYYENTQELICFSCKEPGTMPNLFEFSRICVNKCGNSGEVLLNCSHSVCFECCKGNYFICCETVTDIKKQMKSLNKNYFFLCERHQKPADLFSEQTCQVYCKFCLTEVKTYKISENLERLSKFLRPLVKTSLSEFLQTLSSEKFLLAKEEREKKGKVLFFESVIPEDCRNLSQMWLVKNADVYSVEFQANTELVVNGIYITGSCRDCTCNIGLKIKINLHKCSEVHYQLFAKKCQLLSFDPVEISNNDLVEISISFEVNSKVFCFSGTILNTKNNLIKLTSINSLGIIYGISCYKPLNI